MGAGVVCSMQFVMVSYQQFNASINVFSFLSARLVEKRVA